MQKFIIVRNKYTEGDGDAVTDWLLCQVCPLGVYDVKREYSSFEDCEDGIKDLQIEEMKAQMVNPMNGRR